MIQRDVTDSDGLTWACTQAYAGLGNTAASEAAEAGDDSDTVTVVCTPSGGAQTVRLELPPDWSDALDDAALADAITAARA